MEHQGNSFKLWSPPSLGQSTWVFTFVGGYIDRTFVRMRYQDETETWFDVPLHKVTDFIDDNTITKALPGAALVEVYRATPTDHPIVDYGSGGSQFSLASQSAAARQPLHIMDELVDGPIREALY